MKMEFLELRNKIVKEIAFNPSDTDDVSIIFSKDCHVAIYGKSSLIPANKSWKELEGRSLVEIKYLPEKSLQLYFDNGMSCFISLLPEAYECPERVALLLPNHRLYVL
jgi:hypothetical protein